MNNRFELTSQITGCKSESMLAITDYGNVMGGIFSKEYEDNLNTIIGCLNELDMEVENLGTANDDANYEFFIREAIMGIIYHKYYGLERQLPYYPLDDENRIKILNQLEILNEIIVDMERLLD